MTRVAARVLVTGASGLLCSKLTLLLAEKGYEVVAVYREHKPPGVESSTRNIKAVPLDLTDWIHLEDLILKVKPEVIVHAAAYTDVDGCERDKIQAWRINVEATRSIVRTARVVNSHVVYISTDYVFDGEKGLYSEHDTPNPVNYYGLTKLIGEEIVKSSDLLYTIIRSSAVYGVGGSKKSFAEYIVEKLSRGEEVKDLVDQYVSPTYNKLLAEAVAEVVEVKPLGVLHVAGPRLSRYEFARITAEALSLPSSLVVEARIDEFKEKWIARRPRDSSLDTSRARRILKTPFYDLNLALKEFKKEATVLLGR